MFSLLRRLQVWRCDWFWPSGLGCECETKTELIAPMCPACTQHSTGVWGLIITSQGLPVHGWPGSPDNHWGPSWPSWQVLVVCLYLLFSPAGLFEDKFGDVGGPGIGHVCGQVGSLGLWNTELSLTQQSTLSAGRPEERRGAHCQLGPLNCSQYSAAA